jgi:hypothetical protein
MLLHISMYVVVAVMSSVALRAITRCTHLVACFLQISCSEWSPTSKIEAICSPKCMCACSHRGTALYNVRSPCDMPLIILYLSWGAVETSPLLAHCTSPGWWMMMSVQQSAERLARETKVLGENMLQCRFVHHKSRMTWPGLERGPPRWKAGD